MRFTHRVWRVFSSCHPQVAACRAPSSGRESRGRTQTDACSRRLRGFWCCLGGLEYYLLTRFVTGAVERCRHDWRINEGINTDALDGLFQNNQLTMPLQFERIRRPRSLVPAIMETQSSQSNHTAKWAGVVNG
ncbi:Vng6005h (plasmid) [Halobacterium salinarum NRC-1]|nr:Vng6005h [Halobacterium salinarum NRC-1]